MVVICKKNYIENNRIIFKENCFYEIDVITKEWVWVYIDNYKDIYKFYKKDYRSLLVGYDDSDTFEKHFYTLKEHRKVKLKKIYESNL